MHQHAMMEGKEEIAPAGQIDGMTWCTVTTTHKPSRTQRALNNAFDAHIFDEGAVVCILECW